MRHQLLFQLAVASYTTLAIYLKDQQATERLHLHDANLGFQPLGVCDSAARFQASMTNLTDYAERIVLSLMSSASLLVTHGQLEVSLIDELQSSVNESHASLAECERIKAEAEQDVEAYRLELLELARVARADARVYNGSGNSYLAQRSLVISRRVKEHEEEVQEASKVKRADDVHVAVARAAKKLLQCREDALMEDEQSVHSSAATSAPNVLDLTDAVEIQFANITEEECKDQYQQLRLLYLQAYADIRSLLQRAEFTAGDKSCQNGVLEINAVQRTRILLQIDDARRQMCLAHREAVGLEGDVEELQQILSSTSAMLDQACANNLWTRYSDAVSALTHLFYTQPQVHGVCENMTGMIMPYPQNASLVTSDAFVDMNVDDIISSK